MEITSLLTFLEGMGIDNPCKYLTCRDLLLLGARWDSNPRHSEPQADLRMSHKPCIHRCFRNFRFFVCGYFAAIYARTDSFSINLLRFEMNHS